MISRKLKILDKSLGTVICYILGSMIWLIRRLIKSTSFSKPSDISNVLIIKTVAIGDLVVALPTIKAIRELYPNAKIGLLVTPRVKEVVEGFPYIDEIIFYDVLGKDRGIKGLFNIVRRLRSERYDLVVDLEHYYRFTTLLAFFAGARQIAGFNLPRQGRQLFFTTKVKYQTEKHEVETFLEIPKTLGAKITSSDIKLEPLAVSAHDKQIIDNFIEINNIYDGLAIGLHPGTSKVAISRQWMPERFAELARILHKKTGAKIILTGTNDDLPLLSQIASRLEFNPVLAANLTLKQFAELASRLLLFVSVDTGPLHVVAAMGTPVIGLYGPNTPVKWGPYGSSNISVYKKIECSPCTKQYLGKVSKCSDNKCMKAITVSDVMQAVDRLLIDKGALYDLQEKQTRVENSLKK